MAKQNQTTAEKTQKTKTAISIPVPYINAYGNITKALEGIKTASTPERFTQDFLSAKLNLKGGGATPIIPFLKRVGFLNGDGTPTDIYKEFRNETLRSKAAVKAIKKGYSALFEINEYVYSLSDKEFEGVVVQATGLDSKAKVVKAILHSFNALKNYANFDENEEAREDIPVVRNSESDEKEIKHPTDLMKQPVGIQMGYVINLNLPATTDIAVFDAIFKSLREHILEK